MKWKKYYVVSLIEREWVFPARNSGKVAGDMVKRQKKKTNKKPRNGFLWDREFLLSFSETKCWSFAPFLPLHYPDKFPLFSSAFLPLLLPCFLTLLFLSPGLFFLSSFLSLEYFICITKKRFYLSLCPWNWHWLLTTKQPPPALQE